MLNIEDFAAPSRLHPERRNPRLRETRGNRPHLFRTGPIISEPEKRGEKRLRPFARSPATKRKSQNASPKSLNKNPPAPRLRQTPRKTYCPSNPLRINEIKSSTHLRAEKSPLRAPHIGLKELAMAKDLIASKCPANGNPNNTSDEYRHALLEVINKKVETGGQGNCPRAAPRRNRPTSSIPRLRPASKASPKPKKGKVPQTKTHHPQTKIKKSSHNRRDEASCLPPF